MPIIRKVVTVGDSRGITLPKGWLDFYEREFEQKIIKVCIETEGKILRVYPYIEKPKTDR